MLDVRKWMFVKVLEAKLYIRFLRMKDYKNLNVWKQAKQVVKMIYEVSGKFPEIEEFGLKQQIRKASVSVVSNIAEGCGRQHANDSIQFFSVARGSLFETETQLELSFDFNYIEFEDKEKIGKEVVICKKLLNGLIRHYRTSNMK